MSEQTMPTWVPAHIKVNEGGPERYDLECGVCEMGMSGGATFGPVAGSDMAASFIIQHAVHARGKPAGLTRGGSPSAAFRHYMQGWQAAQARDTVTT